MPHISPRPNCSAKRLYKSKEVSSGAGYAPDYLPNLGGFLSSRKFHVVVGRDRGPTRFFAEEEATARLDTAGKWTRVR